jgi:hypothetical protein
MKGKPRHGIQPRGRGVVTCTWWLGLTLPALGVQQETQGFALRA